MKNLQQTLDALQPYVIGIRYIEKMTVVDTVFKIGWAVPDSKRIKKVKGQDESINYYMFFSDLPNIGLDEILEYVNNVIKINLEREKKHDLLKVKVNELKEFFKNHTLNQLENLKFILAEQQLIPDFNDFDVDDSNDIVDEESINDSTNNSTEEPTRFVSPGISTTEHDNQNLSEEELEILEEEARAANYQRLKEREKLNNTVKTKQKVELPPRKKINEAIMSNTLTPDCDCGPLEACDKCIEVKDL